MASKVFLQSIMRMVRTQVPGRTNLEAEQLLKTREVPYSTLPMSLMINFRYIERSLSS